MRGFASEGLFKLAQFPVDSGHRMVVHQFAPKNWHERTPSVSRISTAAVPATPEASPLGLLAFPSGVSVNMGFLITEF